MKMKRVLALMLSSAMICTAVPGEILAAEEVPAEFSDNVDGGNSDTLEMTEPDVSDSDEEKIPEVELQNEEQDADFEDEGNMFSDGDDFNDGNATSAGESGNIQWELEDSDDDGLDDTLIIQGSGDMPQYSGASYTPWYPYSNSFSKVVIGDGITSIGSNVFYGYHNLKEIKLGKDVTEIKSSAFYDCTGLTEIIIPENVVKIGDYAFQNCTAIKKISMGNNVTDIGDKAFYNCKKLEDVQISNNLVNIGDYAFGDCKLYRIYLPITLKKIGNAAFIRYIGRDKLINVDKIHYPGTKDQWLEIEGLDKNRLEYYNKTLTDNVHFVAYHKAIIPTCDKGGHKEYWTCASCGEYAFTDATCKVKLEMIPKLSALGHILDSGIITKEANCAEEGSMLYTCQREGCGYTETRAIPRTQNHVYGNASYVWSSNNKECTAKRYCTICDNEDSETIETQKIIIKPATCTENGILQYNASFTKECFEAQQKRENINPLNHQNTEIKNKKEASCNENGYTGDTYCKDCGLLLSEGETIPETGHTWNAGTRTKEPTCTENGELVYACKICGKTKSGEIPALGHTEVTDEALAATCETPGKTEGSHCSLCGAIIKEQEEIPATGHKEVTDEAVAPTCENAGKTEGSHCSVCGTIIKEQMEVPALGHIIEKDKGFPATCENVGKTEGSHCSLCGVIIKKQEEIPATGHTIVTIKGIKETCTKTGKTDEKYCSFCGKVMQKQKKIPAAGHKYSLWKTIKEATVLNAKKQRHICSVCKHYEDRNVGNKIKATIKLTTTSLPLKVKQKVTTFKVYGMAKGDSVVSWKSSNSNIVKVVGKSNGSCVITAGSKTGKAVISITLKSKLKKNVTITVTKGNITTTKITGVPSSLKLLRGQKTTLKPSKFPISSKEKIIYTSSNSKIVTVDTKGRVTAKNKGTAIITVRAGEKYVKCKVTVSVIDKVTSNYNKLKTFVTKYGYTNMNNDKVIKETGTVPGTNINTECYIIYEKSNGAFKFLYYQGNEDEVSIQIIPSKSPIFNVECRYIIDGYEIYTTKSFQWAAKDYNGKALYFENVNYNKKLYTWNEATERSQKMVSIALRMINTLILKEYVGMDLKGLGFINFK